jgi:proline iminopeptidase
LFRVALTLVIHESIFSGHTAQMPYPPIEPYDQGLLDVGDDNLIYWETSGNPDGKPALVVHGGPGSGSSPGPRRSFDPDRYRIVQFDQRGCGASRPHAAEVATDLSVNTTHHLIADMERLREHLDIRRWLGRHSEIEWLYRGVRQFFPEAWERFRDWVPVEERDGDLPSAYARMMESVDREVRLAAAREWCAWEDAVLSLEEFGTPDMYSDRPDVELLAFVRICTHYFSHRAWLADGALLRDAGKLAGIPGVLLHGRADLSGSVWNAWELSHAWPGSQLTVFGGSGHKGSAAMSTALLEALDRFAQT